MLKESNLEALEKKAVAIPSMGGRAIGSFLQQAVTNARGNTNVIEVGSWLGAGTAQLAIGAMKRSDPYDIKIHAYDRFEASKGEVKKAGMQGVTLFPGADTLPKVKELLSGFEEQIVFHKVSLENIVYTEKKPISVYVDDAAKTPDTFTHMLKIFSSYWIPGETILVFMDFNYHLKCPDKPDLKFQKFIVDNHPEAFTLYSTLRAAAPVRWTPKTGPCYKL